MHRQQYMNRYTLEHGWCRLFLNQFNIFQIICEDIKQPLDLPTRFTRYLPLPTRTQLVRKHM